MARTTPFRPVRLSLMDLLGAEYVEAVVQGQARLTGRSAKSLRRLAWGKVDFFPVRFQRALTRLLGRVGTAVGRPLKRTPSGATTRFFESATRLDSAPVTGWGYYRLGEAGRLHFLSKSEHYHAPLGHGFGGYRLIDRARRLGIPNATHNNTRGYVTRLLEEELVRTTNGLSRDDRAGLAAALRSKRRGVLNRVLNLETGSLAVEAGIKMMLARFYRVQEGLAPPKYAGRTPVLVVVGDEAGGLTANYHGTTLIAQVLRGMWSDLRAGLADRRLLEVAAVPPNNLSELEAVFARFERRPYKIAGLLHELVLMNYGGLRLEERFVRRIASLSRRHDVPVMIDEIQSCSWSPLLYLFREYGVQPDMVAVGKGLPGGEYAASRIVFSAALDSLPQFGALVTNGQEELASLAYLITMRWAEENAPVTGAVGEHYQARLEALAARFPGLLAGMHGRRHLAALHFHELDKAKAFVGRLAAGGLDISVQTYKAECPPAALTKLPLIAGYEAADMVADRMERALEEL